MKHALQLFGLSIGVGHFVLVSPSGKLNKMTAKTTPLPKTSRPNVEAHALCKGNHPNFALIKHTRLSFPDWCTAIWICVDTDMPRQFYFARARKNAKMCSVVATAPDLALVEGCGNSTALSILQSMNEFRKQDFFTDIHVEVRQALLH